MSVTETGATVSTAPSATATNTTTTTMVVGGNNRAPPTLNLLVQPYVMWKKDIQIWKLLTNTPGDKHGLHVHMSLDNKYKSFVNLSVEEY